MQEKESKSNNHFWLSMAKSTIRILACACLGYENFAGAAILLMVAEIVGVFEEF